MRLILIILITSFYSFGQNRYIDETQADSTGYGIKVKLYPSIAKVKSLTHFKTAPFSNNSHIIRQLSPETEVYVVSNERVNDFSKVIEIKSGKSGWVTQSALQTTEIIEPNFKKDFKEITSIDYSGSAWLTIKKISSNSFTLIIDNEEYYVFEEITEIPIKMSNVGNNSIVIIKNGKLPKSGFVYFKGDSHYTWEF